MWVCWGIGVGFVLVLYDHRVGDALRHPPPYSGGAPSMGAI